MIKTFYVCGSRFDSMGPCRLNGALGSLWQVYVFQNRAWVFIAQGFIAGHRPTRSKVIAMFDDNPAVCAAMKPVGDA